MSATATLPAPTRKHSAWFKWPVTAAAILALLWLVCGLYGAGQAGWAVAVLALGGIFFFGQVVSPPLFLIQALTV